MRGLKVFLSVCLFVYQLVLLPLPADAASSGVVISHVVTGITGAVNQEFVAVYNNGVTAIDISGWCLKNKGNTVFACVETATNVKIMLPVHSYAKFAAPSFALAYPTAPSDRYDSQFIASSSGYITGSNDVLTLIDKAGAAIDTLSWSTTLASNTLAKRNDADGLVHGSNTLSTAPFSSATLPTSGTNEVEVVIDVCPNIDGAQASIPEGMIIDGMGLCVIRPVVDVCTNIEGVQAVLPTGYMSDEGGGCQIDSCVNLEGLQVSIPDGYVDDAAGNCTQPDACDNIPERQATIPSGMVRAGSNDCMIFYAMLRITEILPDAVGSDTGNEFIEVYNPNTTSVDLSLYTIKVGVNGEKSYTFPTGVLLQPNEYRVFTNAEIKFTLVNTSSRVVLMTNDGTVMADSGVYSEPDEGESWALFGETWQYTNQPTPGAENVGSVGGSTVADTTDTGLVACAAGKYRHPITNRCRNIESDVAVLASCDADQYRNPETGRCKKIATTGALTPCKENQYRSEETNRCRNIATTASNLKPCKENQYRSEETNRCRNIQAATIPDAAYEVEKVKDSPVSFAGWAALGGAGALAAGYAGWEWRLEAMRIVRRLLFFIPFK